MLRHRWLLIVAWAVHAHSPASDIVFLPGPLGGSFPAGISANGNVVVGSGELVPPRTEAIIWDRGRLSGLGSLPGGRDSFAEGVSADGTVVVGQSESATGVQAFRWTAGGGMQGLGTLYGGQSAAFGASADGAVIVGSSTRLGGGPHEAFRWTLATGMTGLGFLPGGTRSTATAVSADGTVVTGYGNRPGVINEAFRWTTASGLQGLGFLPGDTTSFAADISADGGVMVGTSGRTGSSQAFRWTSAGGMTGLGFLPGDAWSQAAGVSADGKVVVGGSRRSILQANEAFRWTEATGMQSVSEWLAGAGVTVPARWRLRFAAATNADGSVVTGYADTPDRAGAWIARVSGAGSGILTDVAAYNATLIEMGTGLSRGVAALSHLALFGAHHRSLLDSGLARSTDGACVWATADAAKGGDPHTRLKLLELGACKDFGGTRLGLGMGVTEGRHSQMLGGSVRSSGEYLVAEAAHRLEGGLEGSVLVYHGLFSASAHRNYLNGAFVDTSSGTTDGRSTAIRLRTDWRDAVRAASVDFSPYAAYTRIETRLDGYTESGGGFPATFAASAWRTDDVRAGAMARAAVSPATDARFTLEGVRQTDSSANGVNGQAIGLFGFNLSPWAARKSYARAILDIDHRLSRTALVTFSAVSSPAGAGSNWGMSLGYRAMF